MGQPKKKITIRDIARQCGTSISTVSRVINGNPSVEPRLKEQILAVIRECNWQSSNLQLKFSKPAKMLPYVALVSPYQVTPNVDMVGTVAKLCRQCGFEGLYFFGLNAQVIELCRCLKPHALILISSLGALRDEVAELRKNGTRILYLGYGEIEPHSGSSCFASIDEFMRFSIRTLREMGHTRIGYFGELGEYPHFFGKNHHTDRQTCAVRVMEETLPGFDPDRDTVGDCYGDLSILREALKTGRNTAWICGTVGLGNKLLAVAEELGMRIPEELSVLGLATLTPHEQAASGRRELSTASIDFERLDALLREFVEVEHPNEYQFALPPVLFPGDGTIAPPPRS